MTPGAAVRIEGLQETNRDLEHLADDVDELDETPADVDPTGVGQGRVYASRFGEIAQFNYPTANVRPSRFMHGAIEAAEANAPEVIEKAIETIIRKRGLA